MRLIASGATPPAEVNKYLLPHEQQVITVRQHPAVLIPWIAPPIGGLVVALAMSAIPNERVSQLAAWILTAFLFVEMMLAIARWAAWYFAVTSHRAMVCAGVTRRTVLTWSLSDLRGATLRRPFGGRLFGYGSFVLNDRTTIDFVPYPEQLYLEIFGLVYPSREFGDD